MELKLNTQQLANVVAFLEPLADLFVEKVAEKVKEMAEVKEPRYYTRKEVCELMGITLPTLHEYTKRGDLTPLKMNGRVLYDAWAVDDAIKTKQVYKGKRAKGGAQ